jgi:hypothetical protein
MALAWVGRLNDVRMKKIKSFLRHVGKVNLQLSLEEQEWTGVTVGLYRTKEVTVGTYLHEWSTSKGKEKKPPEQVHYWNANLMNEIEVETNLYLQHLFEKNKENVAFNMPCLDYDSNGFNKKGVTVLFGGDHGDQHCPISFKINLSTPEERKEGEKRTQLSMSCSVLCKHSMFKGRLRFDGLYHCNANNQTTTTRTGRKSACHYVPPKEQEPLLLFLHGPFLNHSYHYSFPTIRTDATDGEDIVSMTFAHGTTGQPQFGALDLVDDLFQGVPDFELCVNITISSFNELFIGDLALLAMLIGMNNSSGSHCLMCIRKGTNFNCNHNHQLTKRTKATLEYALEQFMLKANNPTHKGPANAPMASTLKDCGISTHKGLWSPYCILVPWV